MRPGKTGWLQEYLYKVGNTCAGSDAPPLFDRHLRGLSDDMQLYTVLQPTGLIYGHPIRPFRDYGYNTTYWTRRETMNLVLSDAFVNRALLTYKDQIHNSSDLSDVLQHSVRELVEYYRCVHSGSNAGPTRSRKQWSDLDIAEHIIDQRLMAQGIRNRRLLSGLLYNSLLFIDVYLYGHWIGKKHDGEGSGFAKRQEQVRFDLLKVIACAAHADRELKKEEKTLYHAFLKSAQLGREREEEARAFILGNLTLDDISFAQITDWTEKKYYLEMAILTIWSDREVHELEEEFLHAITKKLGMDAADLEDSMAAIQGFILNNWNKVYFLQRKRNIHYVKQDFLKRTSGVVMRNKDALAQEFRESRELIFLIRKMRKEKLNSEEQKKVREQMLDILKTLPTFVVIALPGTFITLPVLLKLLPKSAFPSAFSQMD